MKCRMQNLPADICEKEGFIMDKPTRKLCLILALGLVIGLPGLASVSRADLLGPTSYTAIIQLTSDWGSPGVKRDDPGDISFGSSNVSIGPTAFDVFNDAASSYNAWARLDWLFSSGPLNLSFDYLIEYDSTHGFAEVDVATASGTRYRDITPYMGTQHFSGTIFPDFPGGQLIVVGSIWGDGHVTISNLAVSAVPLPGALVLLGAGMVRLVAYGRRKRVPVVD
jgi:hypothetical protein